MKNNLKLTGVGIFIGLTFFWGKYDFINNKYFHRPKDFDEIFLKYILVSVFLVFFTKYMVKIAMKNREKI